MKPKAPSPAMVVACVALVLATSGTAIAAVNYARNSGAVDGRSAVASRSTLSSAAGRLVATASKGPDAGRLPSKFVAGVAGGEPFGQNQGVTDNAVGGAVTLLARPGLGTLTATCADQSTRVAIEDPSTTLTFTNQSGGAVNTARRLGNGDGAVSSVAPNTVATITVGGSNTFEMHFQKDNVNLFVDGVVRQDGRGTADANCLVYGAALRVAP